MLNQKDLDSFKEKFRGKVLHPSDYGYNRARAIWNGMIDRKPAIIAQCRGITDVMNSINFARNHDLSISIKGGGHNISGLAISNDGFMIDMSLMRGVWVDRDSNITHTQAGCLIGDVDRETQVYDLAAVFGFVSETGIAGLTLGGGFGYLTRKYGWTSDNLVSIDLVTAKGEAIQASEKSNPDLFWALRGGGGNFGVATGFIYKLFPVGPQIMAGGIAWSADHTDEVLQLVQDISNNAPPEFVCVPALRKAPPASWLSKEIHGKSIIALFVCHTGSLEEGERLVAPIKSLGNPVGDIIQPRTYVSQQSLLDATQPKGRRYYWKSEYLPRLDSGLLAKISEHAEKIKSPHSAILLFPLFGALNEQDENHSAVGNRDARWVINIAGAWEDPDHDEENIKWVRAVWQDIRQYSTGGAYINFMTEDETGDRIQAAYRSNYDRLVKIKRKWDPENIFKMNKNIAP